MEGGGRRTEGGSSGVERILLPFVATKRFCSFLLPFLFSFSASFYATGILNRLDNVIRLLDVFSKNCLNITSFSFGHLTLVIYSSLLYYYCLRSNSYPFILHVRGKR